MSTRLDIILECAKPDLSGKYDTALTESLIGEARTLQRENEELREKLKRTSLALANAYPIVLANGNAPAMDTTRPEIMADVINGDREAYRATLAAADALAEGAKELVNDCEISGPTHMDPPEFVPPHASMVTKLAHLEATYRARRGGGGDV